MGYKQVHLVLNDHRVISWNKLYSQKHWSYRKRVADNIHWLVRESLDPDWPMFTKPVSITIAAGTKGRIPDCDNVCAKLYIDGLCGWLIEDDSPKYVTAVTTTSKRAKANNVVITVEESNNAIQN